MDAPMAPMTNEASIPSTPPRIEIVFAVSAPVAVILRRGPTRWVHVLKWDTRTDSIERGAWFKGRIYAERCALSPDGSLFFYFAVALHSASRENGFPLHWNAISRPPWLTALAMWPSASWGGGYFVTQRTIVLDASVGNRHPNFQQLQIEELRAGATGQALPARPAGRAGFNGTHGWDFDGREFAVDAGRLYRVAGRERAMLCDFGAMKPEKTHSPAWARE